MYRIASAIALSLLAFLVAQAPSGAGKGDPAGITVDKEKRTVTIDAKIAPRKLDYLKKDGKDVIYPIEVVACWPHPKGKKAHETVVTIDVMPSAVHKAIESLGIKPGKPVQGEGVPVGPAVKVYIEVPSDVVGEFKRIPMERALVDPNTGKPAPKLEWRFTGSAIKAADPTKPDIKSYGADISGTLGVLFPVSDDTVLQTQMTMKEEKYVKLETNTKLLPKEGTPVRLVIEVPAGK
jgi:hypothetical protein